MKTTFSRIFATAAVILLVALVLIGTSFQQETDTVAVITTREYKSGIMEAIREAAGLKTEGGAVIFSLPVDSLIGIGRFDDSDD